MSGSSSDRLSEAEHRSLLRLAGSGGEAMATTQQHRTDFDVLKEHFRFAWREGEDESSWGARMAKRYVSKLFKEYALADLSRCKQGQVGLRWRVEREVIEGKGQFICGNLACDARAGLGSWELPFTYKEAGQIKTELVKVRLCGRCKLLLDRANSARGGGGGGKKKEQRQHARSRSRSPPRSPAAGSKKRAREEAAEARAPPPQPAAPQPKPPSRPGSAVEEDAVAKRREEAMAKERERRGREMDELVLEILGEGKGEAGKEKGEEEGK